MTRDEIREKLPLFGNDRVAVTKAAADKVAAVFNALVKRGEPRPRAQRFALQCVVSMFSEDSGLLPRGLFSQLLEECHSGGSTYDLLGGLFRQMNTRTPASGGRFRDVAFFNGGIFSTIEPVDLTHEEVALLRLAAQEKWDMVQPAIFGTLFQSSMDQKERHAYGAHFTREADIQKVVLPTIVEPWRIRIQEAKTLEAFKKLRRDILSYQILDPACGSGNFLYVAFRELVRIELELLLAGRDLFGKAAERALGKTSLVKIQQCHGIDNNAFAVELAKVTLILAKQLALEEARGMLGGLKLELDRPLPPDNLDGNVRCADALFCDWPTVHAIIGNPPYQSKNKMQQEYGRAYLNRLSSRYPEVPGHADYCVYWFRRSHDELPKGGRAGLVGTNTIRQTYSREGGLDYIVGHGGVITEAVSTQVWPGEAVVHVSIVNWTKGRATGPFRLFVQHGDDKDGPLEMIEVDHINSSLSATTDVSQAKALAVNRKSRACYQGQTHGHEGFLLTADEARRYIRRSSRNREVLFPFLTGDELLGIAPPSPQRYVIDFAPRSILEAGKYSELLSRVKERVLPDREAAAKAEVGRNKIALKEGSGARINRHHQNFLKRWWHLSYPRKELMGVLATLPRYIVCARVTKRPIFAFVHNSVHPNDALQVFALSDDYSFGILQSSVHWAWFVARCSTLKGDYRYTSDTVFDTFPWPQSLRVGQVEKVAQAATRLRNLRGKVMRENSWSLRDLYRTLDVPGESPLKRAQHELDVAVRGAYGMKAGEDSLAHLLKLGERLAAEEKKGASVEGPGLPECIRTPSHFVSADSIVGEV